MFKHVFGPVPSRRLGISLGVDLVVPKSCNMNCVFCECGATPKLTTQRQRFKDPQEVKDEIKRAIEEVTPDYITFSGSGEPTLSTDIGEIIDWIKANTKSKVCVITNSLLLDDKKVVEEIKNADLVIPTLNSVEDRIFKMINRPGNVNVSKVMEGLENLSSMYGGEVYLETFIIEGLNDSNEHTDKMAQFIKKLRFNKIQLNSLDRQGTEHWVKPASMETLERIKERYRENGIDNVEIVGKMKEHDKKIKMDKELVENMQSKRKYTEEELETIYDVK